MQKYVKPTDIHKGHRARVRKELMANGISPDLPPHKVLEFILFHSIPRRDTNELAHALLNKFGSFSAVLDADEKDLSEVAGINEASVALLKMLVPILRYYTADKTKKGVFLKSYDELGNYILNRYLGYTVEVVSLLSTNNKGKVISYDIIGYGDLSSVSTGSRKILEIALRTNAAAMAIAHNHPGGIALPSESDIIATKQIKALLGTVNVRLIDHIIVSDNDYVSLAQSEKYKEIFLKEVY